MKKAVLLALVLTGCVNPENAWMVQNRPQVKQQSYEQSMRDINATMALIRSGAPSRTPVTNGQVFSNWASAYTSQDYDWAWDEFYNEYRQLVWACRGKQTGQFAPEEKCMFKMRIDNTWPEK